MKIILLLLIVAAFASAQRITTIQLDGVQYFVSRMNPYSPELNYFLAYQYCRSLGLQLASFETKEKADTMTQYLKNAGYTKYDFWTSGNKLGTDMFLWMSTGLPFNATFDYMLKRSGNRPADVPPGTEPQRVARESGDSGSADGCVAMMAPTLAWEAQDCTQIKDFICEQTRCYYYNYGSIPVSATQGNRRPYITTTSAPAEEGENEGTSSTYEKNSTTESEIKEMPVDPVINGLMGIVGAAASSQQSQQSRSSQESETHKPIIEERPDNIPDITSLFTGASKDTAFEGLETHEIRSIVRSTPELQAEHREVDYEDVETEAPSDNSSDSHTIGPYDNSSHDYVNDQNTDNANVPEKVQDDDSSTILPEAEPAYRYNIKVRSNGKVLNPPSN